MIQNHLVYYTRPPPPTNNPKSASGTPLPTIQKVFSNKNVEKKT